MSSGFWAKCWVITVIWAADIMVESLSVIEPSANLLHPTSEIPRGFQS